MATTFLMIGGPLHRERLTRKELVEKMPNFAYEYTGYNCASGGRITMSMMGRPNLSGKPLLRKPSAIYVHNELFE